MGEKTKIDWCDSTWSPVTGCYHGCEYCYARGIATRFAGWMPNENPNTWESKDVAGYEVMELMGLQARRTKNGKVMPSVYPFGFEPTFHRYKLDEPQHWKKPRTIFVCSMADLFGDWVPDEWIQAVFDACHKVPQHRYLFLTKNPKRYFELARKSMMPQDDNFWFGYTATTDDKLPVVTNPDNRPAKHMFVSIEPMLARFGGFSKWSPADWLIVGAETGNSKDKVVPEKEWIMDFVKYMNIPIFMKESLRELMGSDFRQEFPWEAQ